MRDLTPNEAAINQLQQAAFGLKFEEPPMPMDKLQHAKYHIKYRYDEGITQITRLLMRDGKLGKAQNVRSHHHMHTYKSAAVGPLLA